MRKEFVSAGFIVEGDKTLLVKHRKLGLWLPVGGHIEEGETPEEALKREALEEAGLEIEILAKPDAECCDENATALLAPHHMQVEVIRDPIKGLHHHVDHVFFCRAGKGKARLNEAEHCGIRWFSAEELDSGEISCNIRVLGKRAIEFARKSQKGLF